MLNTGEITMEEAVDAADDRTLFSYGHACWSGGDERGPSAVVLPSNFPGVSGSALWGHVIPGKRLADSPWVGGSELTANYETSTQQNCGRTERFGRHIDA